MIKTLLIILTSIFLFGCGGGSFQKADPNLEIGKKDTLAIYWARMEYDTLIASIKERITFSGDDTINYLPSDRDLTLNLLVK